MVGPIYAIRSLQAWMISRLSARLTEMHPDVLRRLEHIRLDPADAVAEGFRSGRASIAS